MSILEPDHAAVYSYLRGLEAGAADDLSRAAPTGLASGAVGYGAGGPVYLDAAHTKRPPLPHELVDAYKSIAYACIGLNAKGVAKVPLRLYAVRGPGQRAPRRRFRRAADKLQRRIRGLDDRPTLSTGLKRAIDTNDEIDEVMEHPLLEALQKPNPYFDRELFLLYTSASLDAVGSAYFFPERPAGPDGMADPTWASRRVWPLQPQYVFPVKGTVPGELIREWRYFGDTFGPSELVRTRHVSLRDPYLSGYAPLHACYEQTSLVDYYVGTVEGILKGGARPETIISDKDPNGIARPTKEQRERFEKDANRRFSGPRAGRVWYLDGAIDVKTLSYPPVDLGGLELTKEQRLLAANCFDVPISLLQLEDSNRATARESTHQHQYYSVDPRCRLIASAWTAQWAQPVDDRLFFFFDDPVTRDVKLDAEVFDMKVKNGTATINEARENDGLEPVDWGDEPWLSSSLTQPSAAAEDREAKAKLAAAIPKPGEAPAKPEPEPAPDETETPTEDEQRSADLDRRLARVLDLLEDSLTRDAGTDRRGPDGAERGHNGATPE